MRYHDFIECTNFSLMISVPTYLQIAAKVLNCGFENTYSVFLRFYTQLINA